MLFTARLHASWLLAAVRERSEEEGRFIYTGPSNENLETRFLGVKTLALFLPRGTMLVSKVRVVSKGGKVSGHCQLWWTRPAHQCGQSGNRELSETADELEYDSRCQLSAAR